MSLFLTVRVISTEIKLPTSFFFFSSWEFIARYSSRTGSRQGFKVLSVPPCHRTGCSAPWLPQKQHSLQFQVELFKKNRQICISHCSKKGSSKMNGEPKIDKTSWPSHLLIFKQDPSLQITFANFFYDLKSKDKTTTSSNLALPC